MQDALSRVVPFSKAQAMSKQQIPAQAVIADVGESLGLQLYVVHSRATDLHAVKQNLPDHRAYLRELEDSDKLFAAGPLWTADGNLFEGDGLLVYRAADTEEAKQIADADPLHSSGARTYEIMPWLLNDGSLNIRVLLSRQMREVK